MKEVNVFDAVSSRDGKYFAIANDEKRQVILYSSETMAQVQAYDIAFDRMRFASDSSALVITAG
jgi:hypothetical protein